jgi:hypothetical protein
MTPRKRTRRRSKPRGPKKSGSVRRRPGVRRTRKPIARAKSAALRWNPDQDDVQRSVVQLVLTLVELVRKLMERQAIRRMEERTLTPAETEAIGAALMEIERTIRDIGRMFDLTPEELNLDLGAIKLL